MPPRLWQRTDNPLIVTRAGVCGICPACGAHILLVSDDGVDPCPVCGALLRVTVESRPPWQPRGGAAPARDTQL